MYKSFSEYAVRQEVNEFDGKFSNLCEAIYFSDLDFDEYWAEHAIPILLEGNHSSSDELLDKLLDEQIDPSSKWASVGQGLGKVGRWFGDRWKSVSQGAKQGFKGEETGDKWNAKTRQWEKSPETAPESPPEGGESPASSYNPVNLGGDPQPGVVDIDPNSEVQQPTVQGAAQPAAVQGAAQPAAAVGAAQPAAAVGAAGVDPALDHAVGNVKKQFSKSLSGLVNSMKGKALKAGNQHGVAIASSLSDKIQNVLNSFSGRDVSPEALKQAEATLGAAQEKRNAINARRRVRYATPASVRRRKEKKDAAAGETPDPAALPMPTTGGQASHRRRPDLSTSTAQLAKQQGLVGAHYKPEGLVVTESLINYAKKHNLC